MRINSYNPMTYQAYLFHALCSSPKKSLFEASSKKPLSERVPKHTCKCSEPKGITPTPFAKYTWDDVYQKVDDIISNTFQLGIGNSPHKLWGLAYDKILKVLSQADDQRRSISTNSKSDPAFDPEHQFSLSKNWQEIIDEGLLPKSESGHRYMTGYYDDLLSHVLFTDISDAD